jgi:hypothetical protein
MAAYGGFALAAAQDYLAGKTVKALLVGVTYTQNVDTHVFLSDLPAGTEITPSGSYAAGGVALTGITTTYDAATNLVHIDAEDVQFPVITGPTDVGGVLFYVSTGTSSTSRLLGYDAFATPITVQNAILTHQLAADGIFTLLVQE